MKTRNCRILALIAMLVGMGMVGTAQAAPPTVSFEAGDDPGNFFTCVNTGNSKSFGCVPQALGGTGQKSIAVIRPGETVGFPSVSGEASTIHTVLSLLWPDGAPRMPFKKAIDRHHPAPGGVAKVKLTKPGLYVFICDIHVYMMAAVIVDNPKTKLDSPDNALQGLGYGPVGLDLGKKIRLVNGIVVPTASDLALRLLKTFFMITYPANWKDYNLTNWQPSYPPVPVIAYDINGAKVPVANLNTVLQIGTSPTNLTTQLLTPGTDAVGEIWVNAQFELTRGKSKPGTAVAIDGATWGITKKIALPEINMNHPHNMWTDRNQSVIYQTQWFDETLAVFNRADGAFIREVNAGPAPSHVMTKPDTDVVHVAQNGGNNVREFDTLGNKNVYVRDIPMSSGGEDVFTASHPHGHWMSADGKEMVTPNENLNTSTVHNFAAGMNEATIKTGAVPIATGMMPDSSKYYVTNFLGQSISVIDMATNKVTKTINLIEKYDPIGGCPGDPLTDVTLGWFRNLPGKDCSQVGGLPIQTPVSPDGTNMVTANTLTSTITVVDTATDTVVATLGCDPGCHGVQYGAKLGGGYYAYVSSKFSNVLIVVDPAPGGNPANATVVGRILLGTNGDATTDTPDPDTVIGNPGMGGQGILAIPVPYKGWVEQWVANCSTGDCTAWAGQLTAGQKNP